MEDIVMRRFLNGAAVACVLGLGALSSAQLGELGVEDWTPHDTSFRIGGLLGMDQGLRQGGQGGLIGLGLDYNFRGSLIRGTDTFLSIDWFGPSFRFDQGNVIPVMLNFRSHNAGPMFGARSTYWFGGLGVIFVNVGQQDTVWGARAGVGMNLGQHIFSEATIVFGGQARGNVTPTAVGLYIGYRF
jgi:hypothetical protein